MSPARQGGAGGRGRRRKAASLRGYPALVKGGGRYDEMFNARGEPRWGSTELFRHMTSAGATPALELQERIDATIEALGITFAVAGSVEGIERSWPMDFLPRAVAEPDWQAIAEGLGQRMRVLNMFIDDCYNEQRALKEKVVPRELVLGSPHYLKQCRGASPMHGSWVNVCGSDLLRRADGGFVVLEDNLRVPSGIAYMLENREVMYRVAIELFESCNILQVEQFPRLLYRTLASMSPRPGSEPTVVVHTPGIYNSAYFEHAYLAGQMGVELVEAGDMVVIDDVVYLHTVEGLVRVDVIYRRVDDAFIDPRELRRDSVLGVPGLMGAWRKGNVSIANSPGTGVADDKAVYPYIEGLTRFYLGEDPKATGLETLHMSDKDLRDHAFANPKGLVFKPTSESGGKGIVIGSQAGRKTMAALRRKVLANPANFVAQELCDFSTAPTLVRGSWAPCRVDLRSFILSGESVSVTNGGLTRVASRPGNMVVNSSQGGGSKDTWVVSKDGERK